MKKIIIGINLILLISLGVSAQKTTAKNAQIKGSGSGAISKSGNGAGLNAGTAIEAQLMQNLDVKKARVGDQVLLKVVRSVKQNGQTIIPKGANLVGRVTEVQQRTKETAVSRLGVVFDRIQGQDLNSPVNMSIVSITNATANVAAADMLDSDISGTSGSSTRVIGQSSGSSAGGTSSSGGLLGGVTNTAGGIVGTTTNTVGSTVGGVANTTRETAGSVAGATRQTTQTLGQTVKGLQISPSASAGGSASGATTLSAADKNVRIEKGANFQLRVNGN
ncbi:MAG TPA: hypothetical protein VGO50_13785 [Pyrinomonadaceae bacterium]|jgi:hypothetical protein|nr:hypothetical protein [Pyrinomonadaceae bacterium]